MIPNTGLIPVKKRKHYHDCRKQIFKEKPPHDYEEGVFTIQTKILNVKMDRTYDRNETGRRFNIWGKDDNGENIFMTFLPRHLSAQSIRFLKSKPKNIWIRSQFRFNQSSGDDFTEYEPKFFWIETYWKDRQGHFSSPDSKIFFDNKPVCPKEGK